MARISKRLCLVTAVATSCALAALWAQEYFELQTGLYCGCDAEPAGGE